MSQLDSRRRPGGNATPSGGVDGRRRTALDALREASGPLSLADLARDVVRRERDAGGDVDLEAVRECRWRLYHVHVPKLVEVGLATFDADRRAVAAV